MRCIIRTGWDGGCSKGVCGKPVHWDLGYDMNLQNSVD